MNKKGSKKLQLLSEVLLYLHCQKNPNSFLNCVDMLFFFVLFNSKINIFYLILVFRSQKTRYLIEPSWT